MRFYCRFVFAAGLLAFFASLASGQDAPDAGKSVCVNGMQMYYESHGEGKPLVLLHWYGASGQRTWGQFIPKLSTKYRLIIPDLRGHGRSTNPLDTFTHRQSALDVYALLEHLVT